MSYIVEESNDFLSSLPVRMREEYYTVLSQFNYFTTDVYNRKGQTLLDELKEQVKQDGNNEKIYIMLHKFAQWLLVDHLDLQIVAGNEKCRHTRPMKKRMPITAKMYTMKLILYLFDAFIMTLHKLKTFRIRIMSVNIINNSPTTYSIISSDYVCNSCKDGTHSNKSHSMWIEENEGIRDVSCMCEKCYF